MKLKYAICDFQIIRKCASKCEKYSVSETPEIQNFPEPLTSSAPRFTLIIPLPTPPLTTNLRPCSTAYGTTKHSVYFGRELLQKVRVKEWVSHNYHGKEVYR